MINKLFLNMAKFFENSSNVTTRASINYGLKAADLPGANRPKTKLLNIKSFSSWERTFYFRRLCSRNMKS